MLGDVLNKREKTSDTGKPKVEEMTPRDRQILELVCEGMRNKQIATRLNVSETTVSRQVTALSRKLEVEDRTSLVIYAIKQGLVSF
jgi:RNA polymerase sigma factor (sigma-70 family)